MIVKSEMINGKLYFLTDGGEIYKVTHIRTKDIVLQKIADISGDEIKQTLQPTFLKFVDRFNG